MYSHQNQLIFLMFLLAEGCEYETQYILSTMVHARQREEALD